MYQLVHIYKKILYICVNKTQHMVKYILFFCIAFTVLRLQAQVSQGGNPFNSNGGLKSGNSNNFIRIEKPNIDSLLNLVPQTDKKNCIAAIAQRIDKDIFSFGGNWMEKGGRVYELALQTPDASSIIIQFSEFRLPKGAKVFVYNENAVLGAFTSENNKPYKSLTLQELPGNHAKIQIYVPDGKQDSTKLKVGTIGYGIPKSDVVPSAYGGNFFGWSLPCNNEINSDKGIFVQREKRAIVKVVHLEYQFFVGYSAVLINNYKQDGKPYFLTARHCFEKVFSDYEFHPEYAHSAVAYFGYESTTPGVNGDWSKTISGADVLCWDPAPNQSYLDVVLMRFWEKPSLQLNPYYAGVNAAYIDLDNQDERYQCFTAIHHPKMDVKKVTRSSRISRITKTETSGKYDLVVYPDDGVTEQGSSGSPLLDKNMLVIGNLSWGNGEDCPSTVEKYPDGYAPIFAGYDFFPIIKDSIFGPSGSRVVQGFDPFIRTQLMFYPNRVKVNWGEQTLYCKNSSTSNYENFRWDFGNGAQPRYFNGIQPGDVQLKNIGTYTVSLTAFNKTTGKDEIFQANIISRYGPAYPGFYVTNQKGFVNNKTYPNFQHTDTICIHNTSDGYAEKYVFTVGTKVIQTIQTKDKNKVIKIAFSKDELSTDVELANGKDVTISLSQVNPDNTKMINSSVRIFPQTKAAFELKWINSYGYYVPRSYYVLGKTSEIYADDKSEGYNLTKEYYINNTLLERYINQSHVYFDPDKPGHYTLKLVVYNDFSRDSCTAEIDVHLTTGTNNSLGNEAKVYPTICSDYVNIQGIVEKTMLVLFDNSGRILIQDTLSENYQLNTSGLLPGLYHISLLTNDKKTQKTFQIIKQ